MKKHLALALIFAMLVGLCACSLQKGEDAQVNEPASSEAQKYLQADVKAAYPLGAAGQVEALTVCNGYIYAAGAENGRLSFARMAYTNDSDQTVFGDRQLMPLPEKPSDARALGLSGDLEMLHMLLGFSPDDESQYSSYEVWTFAADGEFEKRLALDFPTEDAPVGVLTLAENRFCITGSKNLIVFDNDGQVLAAISSAEDELLPALLLGDSPAVQSVAPETGASVLNIVDVEKKELQPVESTRELGRSMSLCQGQDGRALVNTGNQLLNINPVYECQTLINWYELTGDYGYNYELISQLDSDSFLLLDGKGGELNCMDIRYVDDQRTALSVAVYGFSADNTERLQRSLGEVSSDYRVDLISYSNDEKGMARLISELGGDDGPELIISEGYLVNPALGFADLYTFIDSDDTLSRDSFLPFILQGLERDGRLPQIWSCFGLYSAIATGVLAESDAPLRLADCQTYLDSQGCSEPLFDEYMTGEMLLSSIADNLISGAWDETGGKYDLTGENLRTLIELCASLPKEYNFKGGEEPRTSQVLSWRDISAEYLGCLKHEDTPYRLFAGAGDNFAQVAAYFNSCYMIPENCKDKEKAWDFLRIILSEEYQTEACACGFCGFPTNAKAFETVVNAYLSEDEGRALRAAMENAAFSGYETYLLRGIFIDSIRPYLYGDVDIDTAISNAQMRINIFSAENA